MKQFQRVYVPQLLAPSVNKVMVCLNHAHTILMLYTLPLLKVYLLALFSSTCRHPLVTILALRLTRSTERNTEIWTHIMLVFSFTLFYHLLGLCLWVRDFSFIPWLCLITSHNHNYHGGDTSWPKQFQNGGTQAIYETLHIEYQIVCCIETYLIHIYHMSKCSKCNWNRYIDDFVYEMCIFT